MLVEPCGYGDSTCSPRGDADPLNEVAPAIAHARTELGARRVVLMGASMGGSLTVLAAAGGADADSWVDVSGPPAWEGVPTGPLAARLPAGGLVVIARSDGRAAYAGARRLARRARATFVDGGSGHGYDLLVDYRGRPTAVGRRVLDFVRG